MDELDILLDSLEEPEKATESSVDDEPAADVLLALDEFQTSAAPKDRLEALKLLVQLMK